MASQSRTWQRKILDAAAADGYAGLYWYIEMEWAAGQHHAPAAYPGPWVPVVPVAPDPAGSGRIAGMLAHLFALSNSRGIAFAPALTSDEALQQTGCRWYIWTEDVTIDVICACCGEVRRLGHTLLEDEPAWICRRCREQHD